METTSGWSFEFLNEIVRGEAEALPADMSSKLFRYGSLIVRDGLAALPATAVKPLGHKLWELRLTGRDGIARAIYVAAVGKRVVVVRVFVNKTERTPARELNLARTRAKEVS